MNSADLQKIAKVENYWRKIGYEMTDKWRYMTPEEKIRVINKKSLKEKLRKFIGVLLTPVEKVCNFIVRCPYVSLFILFGSILLIGYMGYIKIAFVMAVSLLIIFGIINRVQLDKGTISEEDDDNIFPGIPDITNPVLRNVLPYNRRKDA